LNYISFIFELTLSAIAPTGIPSELSAYQPPGSTEQGQAERLWTTGDKPQ
jgi:hypothetical protein